MREEVISSGGTVDPTPAATASSAGASSPAVPTNVGSIDGSSHGQVSKAASISCVGSQPPWTSLSTSTGGSSRSCRPWERGDLLRRLATFNPLNWLGKPQIISSLACAQKGWINNGVDKIACESCAACLCFTALSSWTSAEAQNACESFARQLDSGHKVNCPWKGNSCPESLVQFPPTPPSALIGGYKDRCDGLIQFQRLPVVAISAIELMSASHGPQIERFLLQSQNFTSGEADIKPEIIYELDNSQDETYCLYTRAQKLISLCGWEPRWLLNVQDCEEHSAQSERNGYSIGPSKTKIHLTQDPGSKAVSASTKLDARKGKASVKETRLDSKIPWLDCSLCGAAVRISDFLSVPCATRFVPNSIDILDTSKKIGGLIRGASAASGISGWIAGDDTEKDQTDNRDEVATTNEGKLLANDDLDLNLTMAGGFPFTPFGRTATSEYTHDEDMGRDLMIGQPSRSEIGNRAASYESRGPRSRKRNLEKGGSSDEQPILRLQQQADSVEGTVIDRDGDEVTDGGQYSAGPSKRARDSDIFDTYCSPHQRDSCGAGLSHSRGFEARVKGCDRPIGIQATRDSTRASSVIAMDTICHSVNDNSMESVENYPGDLDDVHFPSSSTYGNVDMNETSELNNSNLAQQSTCLQTTTEVVPGEVGVSSTNYIEEHFNAETVTAQARDGISLGISGGSVGMCASHEAEIHGADISVHRADSLVGEMEQRVEDAEHQGQTGESVPDPGLMDEIIPDDMNREDPIGDSQEMMSHSAGRTDSGSKIGCSTKAESVESGEKISQNCNLLPANSGHPSRSCNANIYSGCENTKEEIMKDGKSSFGNNSSLPESDFAIANGIGPPKGESNYEAASTMCELVSMAPTSGGQYHWVAMMAPRSCSKFLSHLTGMLTVGGWQGSVSSSALLTGNMILGMATLNYPDFQPELWQGTLLFWAIFGFAVFINTLVSSVLPKFEGLILILHILGFFAILIPLVTLGPHASASDVFGTFVNNGGWSTNGISFMVGMMGNAFSFVGTDAAFHMSEETVNPSVVVPTSILLSLCINGVCGFAMVIAMVFCMGNLDDAMASGPGMLGFPYMYIFQQATNSRAGATVMSAIIVLLAACATVGMLASTSRVFWSFARDRGLPGWRTLSKVSDRTTVPLYSVLCTAVISILLSLINIGSPVAFQNVTSLSISCLYSSYLIAAGLLLYRRLTKGFVLPGTSDLPALANTTGAELVWGPFHLKGAFGIANNIFAMCYLIVVGFFSFWPPMVDPTVDMMNYSVVVTGGLVIFSVIYYFAWARKEYNGPVVEN